MSGNGTAVGVSVSGGKSVGGAGVGVGLGEGAAVGAGPAHPDRINTTTRIKRAENGFDICFSDRESSHDAGQSFPARYTVK